MRARGAVLAVVVLLAGCSQDPPRELAEGRPLGPGPSQFALDPQPEGWKLVAVGEGIVMPEWGDDTSGTDSPSTVLARVGEDAETGVKVSVLGFEGQQSGIDQSEVPGALTVVVGDDLAVQASGPTATREELEAIVAATVPVEGHLGAPTIPTPPDGFEVVGSVDADGLLASQGARSGIPFEAPGPAGSFGAEWRRGPARLTIIATRGDAADLDALWQPGRPATSDPDAVSVESTWNGGDGLARTIVRRTSWGDLLFVRAEVTSTTVEADTPSFDELSAISDAVVQSQDGWEAMRLDAVGAPELPPDDGRYEIARGTEDGVTWVLQTAEQAEGSPSYERQADACLKLSTGDRPCADGIFGSATSFAILPPVGGFPRTVIVASPLPGAKALLHDENGDVVASTALAQVPGAPSWAGVFVVDLEEPTGCGAGVAWVEVVDVEGASLGCIGR